jgi:hypothetical protein
MKFHWPSFLLGVAAGAAGAAMWERLRPVAVELAAGGYGLTHALWARVATWQEDAEDLLAEARARARERAQVRRTPHARRTARPVRSRRSAQ